MSTEFDGFDDLGAMLFELRDNFEDAERLIQPTLDQAVATTSARVERTATIRAPVDTGTLQNSIGYSRVESAHYLVGTNVEYAPHVEYGTDPHVIAPNNGDVLAFEVERNAFGLDDETIVTSEPVQHPGTPAQPFLRPALREHRSDLVEDIEDAIRELFREVFF